MLPFRINSTATKVILDTCTHFQSRSCATVKVLVYFFIFLKSDLVRQLY